MTHPNLTKTLAGALLTGASVLSGNETVLAVAGGIGVNWASEGLMGAWHGLTAPPGSPLAAAYARALRAAVNQLAADYRREVDGRGDDQAFHLIAECAEAVGLAQIPTTEAHLQGAQRMLAESLAELLHGHDERQVRWLQTRLLPATALAFQAELVRDADARQEYAMWLVHQLAIAVGTRLPQLDRLPEVLAQLTNPHLVLTAVNAANARLEARFDALLVEMQRLAEERPTGATLYHASAHAEDAGSEATVTNEGVPSPPPALPTSGTVYSQAAHAQTGGKATVTNRSMSPAASEPEPIPVLALFADPEPRPLQRLNLLGEARILQNCLDQTPGRFRLHWLPAGTVEELCQQLAFLRPQILHLSGHGDLEGQVLLGRADGGTQAVPWSALVTQLTYYAPPLHCVILNTCHSALFTGEAALARCYLIGVYAAIHDRSAIAFTEGFYQALANNVPIPEAFAEGVNRIRLLKLPDADRLALFRPKEG
jgi:hypothetical protein